MINCIGKDNKIHICEPDNNTALCGMQIKRKKMLYNDAITKYRCIECDELAEVKE